MAGLRKQSMGQEWAAANWVMGTVLLTCVVQFMSPSMSAAPCS
jgi:hypothetical protein